ncbi:MAG: xanthine phosphoribosyltransferase [Ruminococcaceae bacterium]|nr:xanthine phosphoribosyltransferase [Oscillospiraceae bacterium]
MKLLEERIIRDGAFLGKDILKVDSFLNHQIDVSLLEEMGKEWKRLYEGCEITKILTIEASGIGIACMAAREFGVPVVFAKKSKSINVGNDFYSAKAYSFTHQNTNDIIVSKKYLTKGEKIFIIDDFLANGAALAALVDICKEAEAEIVGIGIAIEKWYQGGGDKIRSLGYRIDSLAKIKSMDNDVIEFMD